MALSQRLEFRQSQALVMTPQLMQAIKLLQLSSLDLAAYVEDELERNPLLERATTTRHPRRQPRADVQPPETGDDGAANADWMGADLETSRSSMEQGLGTELENVFPDDGGEKPSSRRHRSRLTRNGRVPAARRAAKTTISKLSFRSRRR